MKRRLFLTLTSISLIVLLWACSAWKRPYAAKKVAGNWKIEQVQGEVLRYSEGKRPHIVFKIGEGRIAGYAYCNSFGGEFTINSDGTCTIGSIFSTRVGCPENQTEQDIFIALQETKKIVVSQKRAYLYNNTSAKGTPTLILVRH